LRLCSFASFARNKKQKTMIKKIIFFLVIVFVAIQFYPRNNNNVSKTKSEYALSISETTSDSVLQIFKTSCYDCHSNNSVYPWYTNIQPFSWWINHHIYEGKEELNFDAWGTYTLQKKKHVLHEIEEQIEEGEMPLESYTWIHKNAVLTELQKKLIYDWVRRN
jgi:hypothetical protein